MSFWPKKSPIGRFINQGHEIFNLPLYDRGRDLVDHTQEDCEVDCGFLARAQLLLFNAAHQPDYRGG